MKSRQLSRIFIMVAMLFSACAAFYSCEKEDGKKVVIKKEDLIDDTINWQDKLDDTKTGLWCEPNLPLADGSMKITFRAREGSDLFDYEGEIYAHIGVIQFGTWTVKADWDENIDACKFTKDPELDNIWHLELKPTVREFFGLKDTPCTQIGIVVRNEDGTRKGIQEDRFFVIKDEKFDGFKHEVNPVKKPVPEGCTYGINVIDDNTITFVLHDEDTKKKHYDFAYIIGDFNNWKLSNDEKSRMWRDNDKGCWWITVSGLQPDKDYRYQYYLGNKGEGYDPTVRIADMFCEKVLDPENDRWIPASTYDEDMTYPDGASGVISVVRTTREAYSWQVADFKASDDLIVYEMLFRDYTTAKDINGALAKLDHIVNLGVNAVELMPIQEFDGNDSWGYNPCYYFALDKAYGTRKMYKKFIDECHKRGIAVIVDVVYNHLTGASPIAKMYWDSENNRTAANNPYFNAVAKHPYNVYHDLNHENAFVKELVKRSTEYLLEEYNIDGFRFDLTKGLTQKNTGNDAGAWGRYDQSRVDILKDYADHIWSVDEDAIVIFEHLSDWDEERVLAQHGILPWRKVNEEYCSAVAGGKGDFSNMYSTDPFGGYIGFMESHDEERLCYTAGGEDAALITWGVIGIGDDWDNDRTMTADGSFFVAKNVTVTSSDCFKIRKAGVWDDLYNYGAETKGHKVPLGQEFVMILGASSQDMAFPAAGTYDIYFYPANASVWVMPAGQRPSEPQNRKAVTLRRAAASAAFFLTVPGPKMIWQFGEIGYDYSINYNDRTGMKPVVTDEYMADPDRKAIYDTYADILKFRKDNPRFFDSDAKFEWTPKDGIKKITCTVDGKSFHVVGNFTNGPQKYTAPSGHNWKDYLTGNAATAEFTLLEGEYKLLTDF